MMSDLVFDAKLSREELAAMTGPEVWAWFQPVMGKLCCFDTGEFESPRDSMETMTVEALAAHV